MKTKFIKVTHLEKKEHGSIIVNINYIRSITQNYYEPKHSIIEFTADSTNFRQKVNDDPLIEYNDDLYVDETLEQLWEMLK